MSIPSLKALASRCYNGSILEMAIVVNNTQDDTQVILVADIISIRDINVHPFVNDLKNRLYFVRLALDNKHFIMNTFSIMMIYKSGYKLMKRADVIRMSIRVSRLKELYDNNHPITKQHGAIHIINIPNMTFFRMIY